MKNNLWKFITSKTHIIPSPNANKFGIQLLRIILANLIIFLRRAKNCRPKNEIEKKLIENGLLVIPNFLPEKEFQQLYNEINQVIAENKEFKISQQGSTKTYYYNFKAGEHNNFPTIEKFFKNEKLIRLISVAEGKKNFNKIDSFNFEETIFGDPENDTDNNVPFHADIHFHSHKILFYTSDVATNNGPFAYCVKSHRNNFQRLFYEFKRGLLKDSHVSSWRIQDNLNIKFFRDYFNNLMKSKIKIIEKRNTLIIANVHGFHQRGKATKGSKRSLIRIPYRDNPLGSNKALPSESYSGFLF